MSTYVIYFGAFWGDTWILYKKRNVHFLGVVKLNDMSLTFVHVFTLNGNRAIDSGCTYHKYFCRDVTETERLFAKPLYPCWFTDVVHLVTTWPHFLHCNWTVWLPLLSSIINAPASCLDELSKLESGLIWDPDCLYGISSIFNLLAKKSPLLTYTDQGRLWNPHLGAAA